MPTAYSYLRFSSVEQAKGDSIRRQTEATVAWCERNRVGLDHTLTLRDEGVNPDAIHFVSFARQNCSSLGSRR